MHPEQLTLSHRAIPKEELAPRATTAFHSVERGNQTLRAIEATGQQHNDDIETVIYPTAYRTRAHNSSARRMQMIADQLNARAFFVEMPGVTADINDPRNTRGARPTAQQTYGALHGDLSHHAAAQIEAVHEIAKFSSSEQIRLIGYSQGATLAAYAAKFLSEEGLGSDATPNISRIDFIDPVNDQDWRLSKLLRCMLKEGKYNEHYTEESAELGLATPDYPGLSERDIQRVHKQLLRRQICGVFLSSIAMYKAFAPVLTEAIHAARNNNTSELSDADMTFYRASGSIVGREEAHATTVQQVRDETGTSIRRVTLDSKEDDLEHHAFPRSHGRFAHLIANMK